MMYETMPGMAVQQLPGGKVLKSIFIPKESPLGKKLLEQIISRSKQRRLFKRNRRPFWYKLITFSHLTLPVGTCCHDDDFCDDPGI